MQMSVILLWALPYWHESAPLIRQLRQKSVADGMRIFFLLNRIVFLSLYLLHNPHPMVVECIGFQHLELWWKDIEQNLRWRVAPENPTTIKSLGAVRDRIMYIVITVLLHRCKRQTQLNSPLKYAILELAT